MLEPFDSPALRSIEISIAGAWRPGRYRDWNGEARASEPIVGVSFAEASGVASWCKSQRPQPDAQGVRLLLGPHDSSNRDALTVRTAELLHIVSVDGSRQIDLYALFLAGSDIKMGRNGLWHLRRDLVDEVPEAYRSMLSRGRTGELAPPVSTNIHVDTTNNTA